MTSKMPSRFNDSWSFFELLRSMQKSVVSEKRHYKHDRNRMLQIVCYKPNAANQWQIYD